MVRFAGLVTLVLLFCGILTAGDIVTSTSGNKKVECKVVGYVKDTFILTVEGELELNELKKTKSREITFTGKVDRVARKDGTIIICTLTKYEGKEGVLSATSLTGEEMTIRIGDVEEIRRLDAATPQHILAVPYVRPRGNYYTSAVIASVSAAFGKEVELEEIKTNEGLSPNEGKGAIVGSLENMGMRIAGQDTFPIATDGEAMTVAAYIIRSIAEGHPVIVCILQNPTAKQKKTHYYNNVCLIVGYDLEKGTFMFRYPDSRQNIPLSFAALAKLQQNKYGKNFLIEVFGYEGSNPLPADNQNAASSKVNEKSSPKNRKPYTGKLPTKVGNDNGSRLVMKALQSTKLTTNPKGLTVRAITEKLRESTRINMVVMNIDNFADLVIEADVENGTAKDVLDAVCREAGLSYRIFDGMLAVEETI